MEDEEVAERVAEALHPPRCPECGEEIDHLKYSAYELTAACYKGEYYGWDTYGVMDSSTEYRCPRCDALIATDEKGADRFLKGKEISQ